MYQHRWWYGHCSETHFTVPCALFDLLKKGAGNLQKLIYTEYKKKKKEKYSLEGNRAANAACPDTDIAARRCEAGKPHARFAQG